MNATTYEPDVDDFDPDRIEATFYSDSPIKPQRNPARIGPLELGDAEQRTDIANGRRLVQQHGDKMRYCHPWRKWLVWDGKRWKVDDNGQADRLAKASASRLWPVLEFAEPSQRKELMRFATATSSRNGISSTLAMAATESGIPILPAELDSDPLLLNCENGTLDLQTGELRPHNQADKITKLCPTKYDPEATLPEWDRFIAGVFPDPEVATFVQRFCGYALTGDVREQILPIWWGGGSNGKSTFFKAFHDTLGLDYATTADKSLIIAQKNNGHSTERMDLFGKRFVITSETENGEKLAESMIKSLTGGDPIRGRRMREDTWQYDPTHKIVLATNHKPEIAGTDHAIWRRLRLIPFNVTFWDPDKGESGPPELMQDKSLPFKFAANKSAILNWAVRGCLDWRRDGLTSPKAITAATATYRQEQDRISDFISECCMSVPPHFKEKAGKFYKAYQKWCNEIGEAAVSGKKFGCRMKELYNSSKSDGVRYHGVALKLEREPEGSEGSSTIDEPF